MDRRKFIRLTIGAAAGFTAATVLPIPPPPPVATGIKGLPYFMDNTGAYFQLSRSEYPQYPSVSMDMTQFPLRRNDEVFQYPVCGCDRCELTKRLTGRRA